MLNQNNQWHYNNAPLNTIPDNAVGFVYEIYNPITDKFYIGKKLFYSSKTIQKNLKKKKIKIESDWKLYNGSNQTLLNDIQNLNPTLKKTILYLCYSKSQCSYLEAYEQLNRNVILSQHYYNDWVSLKVTRKHMMKFQITNNTDYNSIENNSIENNA